MPVTYNKLFHLLLDLDIKKGELQKKAKITASIMARLAKNETVRTDTIGKICEALGCQPGDIMTYVSVEYLKDENGNESSNIVATIPQLYEPGYEEIIPEGQAEEEGLI